MTPLAVSAQSVVIVAPILVVCLIGVAVAIWHEHQPKLSGWEEPRRHRRPTGGETFPFLDDADDWSWPPREREYGPYPPGREPQLPRHNDKEDHHG